MTSNDVNKPVFIDPAIPRKSRLIDNSLKTEKVPLPSVFEISESGTCNRSCSFCPRSDPSYPNDKKFISKQFIAKIAKELQEVKYEGIILFSGFVEPLLDKNIFKHVKVLRENVPNSRIEIVTNGDPLDLGRLIKLFENGLSTILISVYDGIKEADYFRALCEKANLTEEQFVIRHRYLPEDQDFGITLNNRAGMMKNAKFAIPPTTKAILKPCYYPHYTFFVDYLGDVLLCPHDWGKQRVVGNLLNMSFMEIWMGDAFKFARKNLADGNRNFLPCSVCDVNGTLMGSAHKDAWNLVLTK
jgi:MoaA/NifB/PqqE/SkfB family radical SAM enzyme